MSTNDPSSALRRTISRLAQILGDTLVEQEGAELFALEEEIRALAKARRAGDGDGGITARLRERIASLDIATAERVARAFAHYFQLVNLAEQYHRVRRYRSYELAGTTRAGSIGDVAQALRAVVSKDNLEAVLGRLSIALVFTAHPTEAQRRTVLDKHRRITEVLDRLDRESLTPSETHELDSTLRSEVTALWQTDEIRRVRPRVGDEVKTALFYFEEILYPTIPRVYASIEAALSAEYGAAIEVPSALRFGSWVGTDMDGNPNVTPAVAVDTAFALAARAVGLHLRAIHDLGGRLSQSGARVGVSTELVASIARDTEAHTSLASIDERTENEPYRRKLGIVEARLQATRDGLTRARAGAPTTAGIGYREASELDHDLAIIERSLAANRGARAGGEEVQSLRRQVRVFGFHMAKLDLRVAAEWVRETVRTALWKRDDETVTLDDLRSALSNPRPPARPDTPGMRAMEALATMRSQVGKSSAETFILSMARGLPDMLSGLVVARIAGLYDEAHGVADVSITPLFETLDDLARCPQELEAAFSDPTYRRYLACRGDVQEVMIGYSDSNKDAGIVGSSFALYRAQRALTAVATRHGIALTVFHGRGGSIGRGGGPAQRAIEGLPPGSIAGRFKLTEQGEVLGWKYLLPAIAQRNLELTFGGVLKASVGDHGDYPLESELTRYEESFARASAASVDAYRALVRDPAFVSYYSASTPLAEIAAMPIGSRPSKRTGAATLDDLRAIPWVFAWTQSRQMIPGWYGAGRALTQLLRDVGVEGVREMRAKWPFFSTTLDAVTVALATTDLDIAREYVRLVDEPETSRLFLRIAIEHARAVRAIRAIDGNNGGVDGELSLLARQPILARSIALRNPYVDPLSFIQVELLRRKRALVRSGEPVPSALDRAILLTINGIAAGLRNTG